MRMSCSLAVATFLLIGCGSQSDRPRAAEYSAESSSSPYAEKSAALFASPSTGDAGADGAASSSKGSCRPETCASEGFTCGTWDDGCGAPEVCGTCGAGEACTSDFGGTCAPIGSICKASDMRLLGSCVPDDDATVFESGAQCEEHWDSRPSASAADFEYACNCAKGTWSPLPCVDRVRSADCTIEGGAGACKRDVSCFPSNSSPH